MTALWPVLALGFNALVWGLSWWPLKTLESQGLHPLWATAIIFAVSLSCIVWWRPQAWRGLVRYPALWILMLASGLTNVCFNWAVTVGDVVRVVLLFYLMPTWSLLLAWWLLQERPTGHALWRLLMALTGVALVLKTPETDWPVPTSLADYLALLGGFCFALTNVMLRRLHATPEAARMLAMFGGGTFTALAFAWAGTAAGLVTHPALARELGWLAILGLTAAFLLGNLALQYGAARLSAHTTAMVMLSEVVFASVSSISLGASVWSGQMALGGSLILLTALLASRPPKPT